MEATLFVSKQKSVGRFRIENFSLLQKKKGEPVSSGPIIDVGDAKWEILVYPAGNERCRDGFIRVSVRCVSGQRPVRASYTVAVLTAAGDEEHRLEEEATFTSGDGWGFDDFIKLARLKGFSDDVVVFEASVTVLGKEVLVTRPIEGPSSADDLVSDLRAMWQGSKETPSDLTLEVGETTLPVHSLILSMRSPVIAAMLATEMSEASTRVIKITDVDPDTMRFVCEFVYTGNIEDSNNLLANPEASATLLKAAAKYEVHSLVRWCSRKVAATLNLESVADWLILATQIGPPAEALKQRCLQVAASNLSEVQATEGWGRLMRNARVVAEVAPLIFQVISPPPMKKKKTSR